MPAKSTRPSTSRSLSRSGKKYSSGASKDVERTMRELKRGKLKSGSGRKVTTREQAIAIGLSEARKEGERVPAKRTTRKK